MELEGLKRSLSFLEAKGLTAELLITDRHVQGKAFMKKEKPEIRHEFDMWHVSKGTVCLFWNLSESPELPSFCKRNQ